MSAFWTMFERGRGNARQNRRDLLEEQMLRGQMALRESADARAKVLAEERTESARALRERMGYLDRMAVLKRDTEPFKALLPKYPGAGASPYVGEANRYDDLLAREPGRAEERTPLVRDGQLTGPWAPDQTPTLREDRQRNIDTAYDRFGGAQAAREKALEAFRERLAGAKPARTPALDIQYRDINALRGRADRLEQGEVWDDAKKAFVRQMFSPEQVAANRKTVAAWRRQADAMEARVRAAYGQAGAVAPAAARPGVVAAELQQQGLGADEIAAQLEALFSREELDAFGLEE